MRPMARMPARVSSLARDVTEFLAGSRSAGSGLRHGSDRGLPFRPVRCSTARRSPLPRKSSLKARGLCRGGTARRAFVLRLGRDLQHPAARDVGAAAVPARWKNIEATRADLIAHRNIGCMTQDRWGDGLAHRPYRSACSTGHMAAFRPVALPKAASTAESHVSAE